MPRGFWRFECLLFEGYPACLIRVTYPFIDFWISRFFCQIAVLFVLFALPFQPKVNLL
jgi:hypothetical protein